MRTTMSLHSGSPGFTYPPSSRAAYAISGVVPIVRSPAPVPWHPDNAQLVDNVFDTLAVAIKKNKRFSYPGFGTFVIRTRKARTGRNPRTGETLKIKASKTVGFKPARSLKDTL